MNREFQHLKAFRESVTAAKALRTPLSIWPADREFLKIGDLPVVEPEFAKEKFVRSFTAKTDTELQTKVEVGKRYAKLSDATTKWDEVTIGEWR